MTDQLETIKSAAERYGVHPRTIRRRIADGTITAYRIANSTLIRLDRHQVDAAMLVRVPTIRP